MSTFEYLFEEIPFFKQLVNSLRFNFDLRDAYPDHKDRLQIALTRHKYHIDQLLPIWQQRLEKYESWDWPATNEDWFNLVKRHNEKHRGCTLSKIHSLKDLLLAMASFHGRVPKEYAERVLFEEFLLNRAEERANVNAPKVVDEDECVVCYEPCTTTTECNHRVCHTCVESLLSCPYCRRPLEDEDYEYYKRGYLYKTLDRWHNAL